MEESRIQNFQQITLNKRDLLNQRIFDSIDSKWIFIADIISNRHYFIISSPFRFSWRPSQGGPGFDAFAGGKLSEEIENSLIYPRRGTFFLEVGSDRFLDCGMVHYAGYGIEPRITGKKIYWIHFHLSNPIDFGTWNSVVQRTRWSAIVNGKDVLLEDAVDFAAIWAGVSASEVIDIRLMSYSWDVRVVINGRFAAVLKDADRWAADIIPSEEEQEVYHQKFMSSDRRILFDYMGHDYEILSDAVMTRNQVYTFIENAMKRSECTDPPLIEPE